ncbi:hypothetical protein D3C73_718670 [compost metagenome]
MDEAEAVGGNRRLGSYFGCRRYVHAASQHGRTCCGTRFERRLQRVRQEAEGS